MFLSSCVITCTCTLEETKSVDIFGRTKQTFSNLVQTVPVWIFSVRIFVCLVTLSVFRIQTTLVVKMFCRIEYYIWWCPGTLTLHRQKSNISNICKRNSSPLVVSSSCTFPQQILNHYIGSRWFRKTEINSNQPSLGNSWMVENFVGFWNSEMCSSNFGSSLKILWCSSPLWLCVGCYAIF